MNDSIFIRASEKKNEIKALKLSSKTKFINCLISILISALICCGPLCLCINLIIFYDFMTIVAIGIGVSIGALYYLAKVFYYKSLAQDKCGSLKDIYLSEFFTTLLIVIAVVILL